MALTCDVLTMCSPKYNPDDVFAEDCCSNSGENGGGGDVESVVRVVMTVVCRTTVEPLVAPHYTLLTALLNYVHAHRYFDNLQVCVRERSWCSFDKDSLLTYSKFVIYLSISM